MIKEPTINELKSAKANLEKQIKSLLVDFSLTNGVTVSNLKLDTYRVTPVCGDLSTRYSKVEVEIIL